MTVTCVGHTAFSRWFCKTWMALPAMAVLTLGLTLGLIFVLEAKPVFAADFVATEASVYARGSVPAAAQFVSVHHNGNLANGLVRTGGGSSFITGGTTFPGPPGSITSVLSISLLSAGSFNDYDIATVSITANLTTAFTTVIASDPERTVLGGNVTLTADGLSASANIDIAGNVTVSTFGNPLERNRKICAIFNSGVEFCVSISVLDMTTQPLPTPDGPFATARDDFIDINYVDPFRRMAEQMSAIMLQQMQILGTFFDAKNQLESQRLFGETAATAHRDYHPSEQLCAFGTLVRSTAIERYSIKENILAMNTIFQKRELLNANTSSAWGPFADAMARKEKFKAIYCDPNDNNRTLPEDFCDPTSTDRKNKDVDYRQTLGGKLTLDINYVDGAGPTADEEDILALAKNLYAHQTLPSIPKASIEQFHTFREFNDSRMLVAMRSVARYSYSTQASMRMAGSGISAQQLSLLMENLGVPAADVIKLIGKNPSYFAQMEILTQKMFQDPSFVVNLYSGPANVARMGLVLQGIRIMADRDKLEASLRREMLLSLILEMKLRERQDAISNKGPE